MWPETRCYFLTKLQNLNYKTSGSACLKGLAILKFHHQLFLPLALFLSLSFLSSPQVNNPSCPGLSEEIPHKYPPCFLKRPSSGTVSGADTTPTDGKGEKKKKKRDTVAPSRLVGWLVGLKKIRAISVPLPLAASGPRTFLWISVVFYTCGKSTTQFRRVPPNR